MSKIVSSALQSPIQVEVELERQAMRDANELRQMFGSSFVKLGRDSITCHAKRDKNGRFRFTYYDADKERIFIDDVRHMIGAALAKAGAL